MGQGDETKRARAPAPPGDHALFVGRLDATKGIDRLMQGWPQGGPELRVVGDGPLAHLVTGTLASRRSAGCRLRRCNA